MQTTLMIGAPACAFGIAAKVDAAKVANVIAETVRMRFIFYPF